MNKDQARGWGCVNLVFWLIIFAVAVTGCAACMTLV